MAFALDIVFQSGDFSGVDTSSWWLDLLNTIIGAAIGSGVTIWALYRTFRQDKQADENKKIEFQKEKLRYFQSLIRSINKDLKLQIENFKTFSDAVKANPLELPLLGYAPLNDLTQAVHKIDQEDYYHSYLSELGKSQEIVEEFREIYSYLNFFDGNMALLKISLQKAVDFDYGRKMDLKRLIEKSMNDTMSYLANSDLKSKQPAFIKFLNDRVLEFHKNKPAETDLTYYIDNFVNKIKTEEFVDFALIIPEAHDLIIKLRTCSQDFGIIKLQNNFLAGKFEQHHKLFDTRFSEFQDKVKRLDKYNT